METDYFRWKKKWRLEHLGTLGIVDEIAPLSKRFMHAFIHSYIGGVINSDCFPFPLCIIELWTLRLEID